MLTLVCFSGALGEQDPVRPMCPSWADVITPAGEDPDGTDVDTFSFDQETPLDKIDHVSSATARALATARGAARNPAPNLL